MAEKKEKTRAIETVIAHSEYRPPEGFRSYAEPTTRASTVLFDSVADMLSRTRGSRSTYVYGLHGTPLTFTLEEALCDIEGAKHAALVPSGLAAITLVDFAVLKAGDEVLLPENVYFPNRGMADWLKKDFGVNAVFYPPLVGKDLSRYLSDKTKLVWIEAPGSITMEVPDVTVLCEAAHAVGAICALDNTWSAGLGFNAFKEGADIVVQALTKFQSGGSDLLMGAVLTNDEELFGKISSTNLRLGMCVGADDAYTVLRSLPSMSVRFNRSSDTGLKLAAWLKEQSQVVRVHHPAFEDCPGHDYFREKFTRAAGLFSVLFDEKYDVSQIHRFVDSLELFGLGYSWGGTHSLCVPYTVIPDRKDWALKGHVVRFYTGMEDPDDLIADCRQAIGKAFP